MEESTLKEQHVKLWTWLAENPEVTNKEDWPGWDELDMSRSGFGTAWAFGCFACQCAFQRRAANGPFPPETELCAFCPCKSLWPEDCCEDDTPFVLWDDALDPEIRKINALKIANGWED
jgi:hypothetical protein